MFKESIRIKFDKTGEWNNKPIVTNLHRPKLSINPNTSNHLEIVSLKSQLSNKHANVSNIKRYKSVNAREVDRYHNAYDGSFNN